MLLLLCSATGGGASGCYRVVASLRLGLLRGGLGWRLCNWQRHASELSTTCHSNSPGQSRAVARAFFADFDTLSAVGSSTVTLDLALLASKAVLGSSSCRCSSSPFPGGGGSIVGGGFDLLRFGNLGGSWRNGHGC